MEYKNFKVEFKDYDNAEYVYPGNMIAEDSLYYRMLSGTGVTAGTAIYANGSNGAGLTGSGLAGTYVVQYTQTASTGTLTGATNVETKWVAVSAGLTGEVVKITDHLLG
jgi:hypothetical protein